MLPKATTKPAETVARARIVLKLGLYTSSLRRKLYACVAWESSSPRDGTGALRARGGE
jgi:hypothetical protein